MDSNDEHSNGSNGAGNSRKAVPGRPFVKGKSGNPAGRPRGLVKASQLVQATAQRIALMPHPNADKLSNECGRPIRTYLDAMLLSLAIADPKTFLAYYAGKPVESVDLNVAQLPPVVDVSFGDLNPEHARPTSDAPLSAS